MELDGQAFAVRHFSAAKKPNHISVLIIFEAHIISTTSNGDTLLNKSIRIKQENAFGFLTSPLYEKCIILSVYKNWLVRLARFLFFGLSDGGQLQSPTILSLQWLPNHLTLQYTFFHCWKYFSRFFKIYGSLLGRKLTDHPLL